MLCPVLLKWLEKHINAKLRQLAGLGLARSFSEQIFTLQNIVEQLLEHCWPLIVTYVDFKKVLHSIYGHILWKILKTHSASQGYIDIFQELYAKSQCYIKIDSRTALYFKVETGVQQGHISSLFFFLLVMDYLIKNAMHLPHLESFGRKGNWLAYILQMTWYYLPIKVS